MPSDSFLNSFKESSIEKVLPSSPALLGVDLREDIYSFSGLVLICYGHGVSNSVSVLELLFVMVVIMLRV